MRKIFTLLFLVSFAFAQAQYYIPNSGFENWKGSAGSTYQSSKSGLTGGAAGLRQRPGNEPSDWEGSSVNQKVIGVEASVSLVEKIDESYNSSPGVKMINKFVGKGTIGDEAPGFISFATPWVYAVSNTSNCDGGVYGGRELIGRPDAIKGMFNRSGGTGELAHIIVYTWNGTYKQNITSHTKNDTKDDTDRAVMGRVTDLVQEGKRIASCDYSFASTNGWEEIVVPLSYNYDEAPEKMNVILSSGDYWTRGNIKEGSVLEADDVQFVYYSELESLKYDGVNYFSNGNTSYTVPAAYDESKLEITSNGAGAKIEKSFEATSNTLTITIKGDDFSVNNSNQHVYTVVFDEDAEVVVPEGPKPLGERLYNLADADENKTYLLYNEHFTTYAVYEEGRGDKVWVAGMRGDSGHPLTNSAYGVPVDVTSENACWQVIKDGDKYQLYNVGVGMYLTTPQYEYNDNLKYCSFSSEPVSLSVVDLGGGKFAFNAYPSHANADLGYMCAAPQLDAPLSVWDTADAGSAWVLIENPNVTVGEVVDPELPDQPEIGIVDYTPTFTGVKTASHTEPRWIETITLNSAEYSEESANTLSVDNSERLCYNDYSETVTMVAAAGEEVTLAVSIGNASWMNAYVYIDSDEDGFDAGIDSDGYTPTGDLMSYSFYNNGSSDDNYGYNSAGESITGNARSTVELPKFVLPEEPGIYRMRVKLDWCSIDPAGDNDANFGNFMTNGGQIVDFMIEVVGDETPETEIDEVEEEVNPVFEGIYDLQGRKLDEVVKTGIYIVNGKKVFIKK